MGHRLIQRIHVCYRCGRTPEDGEDMWWMDRDTWCTDCIDHYGDDDEDEGDDEEPHP